MNIVPEKECLDILTVYKVRGNKDDVLTANFVNRVGDNPAALKYGYTNIVTFVTKGKWELSGGKIEEPEILEADWGPNEKHRVGKCTYKALEDKSEVVTIIPNDRDQFWDRRRIHLPTNGDFIGDNIQAEELLYVVKGSIVTMYDNMEQEIQAGGVVRVGPDTRIHVRALEDIDIVYMKYKV